MYSTRIVLMAFAMWTLFLHFFEITTLKLRVVDEVPQHLRVVDEVPQHRIAQLTSECNHESWPTIYIYPGTANPNPTPGTANPNPNRALHTMP